MHPILKAAEIAQKGSPHPDPQVRLQQAREAFARTGNPAVYDKEIPIVPSHLGLERVKAIFEAYKFKQAQITNTTTTDETS